MNKPVGGRGNKAPYDTVVMRVPLPLAAEVKQNISEFHDLVCAGVMSPGEATKDIAKRFGYPALTAYGAIIKAKEILKAKKSARQSLLKLLQELYGEEVTDEDLKP